MIPFKNALNSSFIKLIFFPYVRGKKIVSLLVTRMGFPSLVEKLFPKGRGWFLYFFYCLSWNVYVRTDDTIRGIRGVVFMDSDTRGYD